MMLFWTYIWNIQWIWSLNTCIWCSLLSCECSPIYKKCWLYLCTTSLSCWEFWMLLKYELFLPLILFSSSNPWSHNKRTWASHSYSWSVWSDMCTTAHLGGCHFHHSPVSMKGKLLPFDSVKWKGEQYWKSIFLHNTHKIKRSANDRMSMMVCIQLSAGPSNVVIYLCSSVSAPWCNRNTRSSQSIGSMSQGGICVLVGNHYDTMVLYYIIHWIAKYKNVIH